MKASLRPGTNGYWLAVTGYVVAVLAVQPFMGFAIDAVKARWGEGVLDAIGYAGAGMGALLIGWVLVSAWRSATRLERWIQGIGLTAYGAGAVLARYPQERLHYLEYGLLAGLLYLGLVAGKSRRGSRGAVVGAVTLGTALGLLDEVLQIAWPRRYFDWADVGMNVLAVLLGLLVAVPACAAWRRAGRLPRTQLNRRTVP